jgi:hypothetical protein
MGANFIRLSTSILVVLTLSGCASLERLARLIQPPQFQQADNRPGEIRLLSPSARLPAGGAAVRIWTTVTNPNPFGFTLSTLRSTLYIEDSRAADAEFPLGLPLRAREASTIPLDLSVSFSDLPELANVLRRALSGQPIRYRLDGTVGVDAGSFGQPTFGPMTLAVGELQRPLR